MRVWYVLMALLTGFFTYKSFALGDNFISYMPTLIMFFFFIFCFTAAMLSSKKKKNEETGKLTDRGDDE